MKVSFFNAARFLYTVPKDWENFVSRNYGTECLFFVFDLNANERRIYESLDSVLQTGLDIIF
jgi:hypothetical protein